MKPAGRPSRRLQAQLLSIHHVVMTDIGRIADQQVESLRFRYRGNRLRKVAELEIEHGSTPQTTGRSSIVGVQLVSPGRLDSLRRRRVKEGREKGARAYGRIQKTDGTLRAQKNQAKPQDVPCKRGGRRELSEPIRSACVLPASRRLCSRSLSCSLSTSSMVTAQSRLDRQSGAPIPNRSRRRPHSRDIRCRNTRTGTS